jgi:hypothetical protein
MYVAAVVCLSWTPTFRQRPGAWGAGSVDGCIADDPDRQDRISWTVHPT